MRNLFLFLLFAIGTISTAEVVTIVTTASPYSAPKDTLLTFFIGLFISGSAISSLSLYLFKRYAVYHHTRIPSLGVAVRQSALLWAIIVGCLFFNSIGILSAWEVIPLLLSVGLIELFFQADKTPRQTT